MSNAVPTYPAAVDALVDLVKSAQYPHQPQVSYGIPADLENIVVIVGGGTGSEDWGPIGDLHRDEDYTIDVAVMVAPPGLSAVEAKDMAWAIWTVIAQTLREAARNRLADGVLWNAVGDLTFRPTVEDEGYGHVITATIKVGAQT